MATTEATVQLSNPIERKKLLEILQDLSKPIEILAPHEFVFAMVVWIVSAPFLLIRRVYETVTA